MSLMRTSVLTSALLAASAACVIHVPGSTWSSSNASLGEQAERSETRALELAPGEGLSLECGLGDIELTASGETPELRATVRAHGRTREEAQAALARFELRLERRAGGVHVELVGEPLRVRDGFSSLELSAQIDFEARVPAGTSITARSGGGELVTRGALGPLALDTGFGVIQVEEAAHGLHAHSGAGAIEVGRLDGDESVLESDCGRIHVQSAGGHRVSCKSGSGDLQIDASTCTHLELDTGFGAVRVDSAGGAVQAKSDSGNVRDRKSVV